MKRYIFAILATLLISTPIYSQKLRVEIDLKGLFTVQIAVDKHSSITLNPKGDILSVNIDREFDDDLDYGGGVLNHYLDDGRITRLGGVDIEYDFHTDKISKIGDVDIDYDFHTERISEIGEFELEYDFHTDKISEIGDATIEYDFHAEKISEIGDVEFSYDLSSSRLESIESEKFRYEFNHNGRVQHRQSNTVHSRYASNRVIFRYEGVLFFVKIR